MLIIIFIVAWSTDFVTAVVIAPRDLAINVTNLINFGCNSVDSFQRVNLSL